MTTTSRLRHAAAAGGIGLTLVAPGAALAHQDLRSPDARDVARGLATPTPARAAAPAHQDLRSPDARDVAGGLATPTPAPSPVSGPGADTVARMMERYQSSYRSPVAAAPRPAPDGGDGVPGALIIAATAGAGGLLGVQLRRARRRRRVTA